MRFCLLHVQHWCKMRHQIEPNVVRRGVVVWCGVVVVRVVLGTLAVFVFLLSCRLWRVCVYRLRGSFPAVTL